MGLLWPGYDQERGRRAIRNALYSLRQQLGADAIISIGETLVGLDPAIVTCDALDLERGGQPRTSMGFPEPFSGLRLDGAEPFEVWLSTERQRLHSLYDEQSHGSPVPPLTNSSSAMRRPHALSASSMYVRGHYLFLRNAHGGSPKELLQCRDFFERARELDPSFAPALAGLANFYAVAARRGVLTPFHEVFAEAIRLSHEALSLDNSLAIPHVHLAVKALYLDGDWPQAEREFVAAVTKDPEYAEGHRFYGVWLGLAGRYDEARQHMEVAARLEPDIPHMLSSLSAARLACGDRAGAEAALRYTLSIDPHHRPARARLIQLLEESERFEEALVERGIGAVGDAASFAHAYAENGAEGYNRQLQATLRDEATLLETRLIERHVSTVEDLFAPPIVRLVQLYIKLGDTVRARSWQLQGVAARPALAHWFAAIPELRRAGSGNAGLAR